MRHLKFLLTFREQKEMLVKQLQRTFGEQQGVTDPIVGILLVRMISFWWWFSVVYFQHNKVKIHIGPLIVRTVRRKVPPWCGPQKGFKCKAYVQAGHVLAFVTEDSL